MQETNVPQGFAMALAQNADAANTYAMMTREEKKTILEEANAVRSQRQMQKIIDGLAKEQQI